MFNNQIQIIMEKFHFRVHTPNLLKEIVSNSIPRSHGVLFVPLNSLRILLGKVAERASELNDPILNQLMFDMTLYEIADPESKDYDSHAREEIYHLANLKRIEEQNV